MRPMLKSEGKFNVFTKLFDLQVETEVGVVGVGESLETSDFLKNLMSRGIVFFRKMCDNSKRKWVLVTSGLAQQGNSTVKSTRKLIF